MEQYIVKEGDIVISPITHKSNCSRDKNPLFDRFVTKGKEYVIEKIDLMHGLMFIISDDNNKLVQCFLKESASINYMDWIIKK